MLPNHIVFLWFDFGDGGNIPLHKATYRKPRANERNIACQQLKFGCYMLRPCYMLLRVVWSCCAVWNRSNIWKQLPTFLFFRDRRSVAQPCWIHLHSSSNIVGTTHTHLTRITKIVSFPWCTAGLNIVGSCCIRLHTRLPTRTQQLPTMLARQCWELLRPFALSLRVYEFLGLKAAHVIKDTLKMYKGKGPRFFIGHCIRSQRNLILDKVSKNLSSYCNCWHFHSRKQILYIWYSKSS